MDELRGLLLDGGDNFWMAVSGSDDRDARVAVEEPVSVDVKDQRAFAASIIFASACRSFSGSAATSAVRSTGAKRRAMPSRR